MRIGRIIGTVTATIKDRQLAARKLLVVDIEDGRGQVLESSIVAVDVTGAGTGEMVLLVTGSAARMPEDVSGIPIDATIVATIDEINLT